MTVLPCRCRELRCRLSISLCTGHLMKLLKLIILAVIGGLVLAFAKAELRHLMHEGFWPGLAGVLFCLGLFVVATAIRARARRTARTSGAVPVGGASGRGRIHQRGGDVGRLLAAYPGPVTLKPSRMKWGIVTALGVVMTAACILVGVLACLGVRAGQHDASIGLAVSVFGVLFFGGSTALCARTLWAGALQLGGRGFQVTLFGRKEYLWVEVSDFEPYRQGAASGVRFNAVQPRSRFNGRMNVWLGYSNDALTDTYGLAAEELADLLEAWRSTALGGERDDQLPASVSEQDDRVSKDQPSAGMGNVFGRVSAVREQSSYQDG